MSAPSQTPAAAAPAGVGLPRVFGRYLLLQRLSSGGMGEIFLAKHGLAGFEKICVIKKILPHLSADEHFISRFEDEAQVAIQLQHANIAQVFEVGRVDDAHFLSLELVAGCDLRRALTRLAEQGQRFPVDLALLIAREVASGLAYAHRRTDVDGRFLGLVHCDISPPNVMLSFEGEVKIIDFGIAKSAASGTATDPKMGFGKLGYMASEQLVHGGRIDHRTDVYAAGSVLFELLTGHRLYAVDGADYRTVARQIVRGAHALPSHLDPALLPYDALVAQALATDPAQRYANAAVLRDAIQQALVAINPTVASDHLGSFIRRLFADEMADMRRLTAQAQGADLGPWQDQLGHRATVSFALAALQGEATVPSPDARAARPAQPARRRYALWGAAASALLAGSALAAVALVGAPDAERTSAVAQENGGERAVAAAADAAADAGAAAGAATVADSAAPVSAPDSEDAGVTGDRGDRGDGDDRRRARGRTGKRKAAARKSRSRQAPSSAPDGPGDGDDQGRLAAAVQAKFAAVSREYRAFKSSYGARLEQEWADLANQVLYTGEDPDRLRRLSSQLDRFRARMRDAK